MAELNNIDESRKYEKPVVSGSRLRVNLFYPNELLYAIDYAPFLPEVAAALASGFNIS